MHHANLSCRTPSRQLTGPASREQRGAGFVHFRRRSGRGILASVEILPTERPNAYVLRVDGADQSHVDLDDPTRLDFDYVRRMGDVLDAWQPAGEPLRVVHVGGAGMTLPRYVAATRPRSSQIVLEPAEAITELVRGSSHSPAAAGSRCARWTDAPGSRLCARGQPTS